MPVILIKWKLVITQDSFQTPVLLQFIHQINLLFLSFFFHLVLAQHVNVLEDPCSLWAVTWCSVMWPLYAVTGLWLILLNSFDGVDDHRLFQSLQSFPLHYFLNMKMNFFHEEESLSPSLIRTCCREVPLHEPLSLASSNQVQMKLNIVVIWARGWTFDKCCSRW